MINITYHNGTFVTTAEPTLLHHYPPKPVIYLSVHSWCCTICGAVHCVGLDRHIMTCIHHYDMIQRGFPALCPVYSSSSPQPLATADLFIVPALLPFPKFYIWNHTICTLFQTGLFQLIIWILRFLCDSS